MDKIDFMKAIMSARTDAGFKERTLKTFHRLIPDTGMLNSCNTLLLGGPDYFDLYVALQFIGSYFAERDMPFSYLEVGTKSGGSLLQIYDAAPSHIGPITVVDVWGGEDDGIIKNTMTNFLNQLDHAKVKTKQKIEICHGDSDRYMNILHACGRKFDVITIDARHEYEYADRDLEFATKLLNPSGIIVFDDTHHPLHSRYMKEIVDKHRSGFELFESNSGNGVAVLYR